MQMRHVLSVTTVCLFATSTWAQEKDLVNRFQHQRAALGALVWSTSATSDFDGVVIRSVDADSAADKSGLQEGDILLRVGGTRIKSPTDLLTALSAYEPGESVSVRLVRDGAPRTVNVTLREEEIAASNERERGRVNGQRDRKTRSRDESELNQDWLNRHASRTDARWRRDNPFYVGPESDPLIPPEQPDSPAFLGVAVEVTSNDSNYNGVVIRRVQPNSPAEQAGLRTGDILIRVKNARITEPEDLSDALSYYLPGDKITFVIIREDSRKTVSVTLRERPSARATPNGAREQRSAASAHQDQVVRGQDEARREPGWHFQ